jgi:FlaA1/EpsC-like NDP-sugar epimerase
MTDIAQGKIKFDELQEVDIADLLSRDSVAPDQTLLHANIAKKIVMVTGSGGTIGSELCRQIIILQPAKLILFELNEFALYSIQKELIHTVSLLGHSNKFEIISLLGSVVDETRINKICKTLKVQTIYHAAAYKHVPLVEQNPCEAIKNNIYGTLSIAQTAIKNNVETFVLISTDKAVRPTSTMGATKRFAELILQGLSLGNHSTRFTMVRFGNVLGSSGSVIPLFREQIARGGPVTVTDPRILRYFMTIPEAAQLVIQAGAMGKGGDVFVLDMGEPIRILDLAKRMIHLSGLEIKDETHPKGEIEISYTGLRPGEKLFEELLIGNETSETAHCRIMRAEEEIIPLTDLFQSLGELKLALKQDNLKLMRDILEQSISGFKPQCELNDLLLKEEEKVSANLSKNKKNPLMLVSKNRQRKTNKR